MKPKSTVSVDLTGVSSFQQYFKAVEAAFKKDVPLDRNYLELSEGETCPECGSWDTYWSKSHHLICNKCGEASCIVIV